MLLVAAVLEVVGWLLAAPLFYISCHLPPSLPPMPQWPLDLTPFPPSPIRSRE